MKIPSFILLFCASAWMLRGDSFSYDDSGRFSGAVQSGLVSGYSTDDEANLLTATFSSTDTPAGGGTGPGNGIADWWENYYFGTTGIDPNASLLEDGVSNLMKFALGLDPTQNLVTGQLPGGIVEGSNMSLIFRVGKDATNLVYTVQSSTDLASWTDLTAETEAALALPPLLSDETSDSYKVSIPLSGGNKDFLRLSVTAQ